MKFYIRDFFRKRNQIRRKLRIWSDLMKKSLIENFISCAVVLTDITIVLFLSLQHFCKHVFNTF